MAYIRRCGHPEDIVERSLSMDAIHLSMAVQAVEDMRKTGRNDLGIVLGVIRSLRDNNLLAIDKFTIHNT